MPAVRPVAPIPKPPEPRPPSQIEQRATRDSDDSEDEEEEVEAPEPREEEEEQGGAQEGKEAEDDGSASRTDSQRPTVVSRLMQACACQRMDWLPLYQPTAHGGSVMLRAGGSCLCTQLVAPTTVDEAPREDIRPPTSTEGADLGPMLPGPLRAAVYESRRRGELFCFCTQASVQLNPFTSCRGETRGHSPSKGVYA